MLSIQSGVIYIQMTKFIIVQCTCNIISFQVKKTREENLKRLLRVEVTVSVKEVKRKEAEENVNKKTDEVSEASAAKTAIDKKESASAQFKHMRAWIAAAGGESETGPEENRVRLIELHSGPGLCWQLC